MADKGQYNNLALCYHGIVDNSKDTSAYNSYTEDFKGQITYLKQLGYTFVKPTKYFEWYTGNYNAPTPIVTLIFDDALASINLVVPWLIDNEIPFGIAVIGRKLRKHIPEEDFLSWTELKTINDSGFCEILSHSYNLHHSTLVNEQGKIISAPILEAPCHQANGEFIYASPEDNLWYWDFKHIDDISWAFPIIGTDTGTGMPITSTVTFKSTKNVKADKLILWACLHNPYGSGYNAKVKIYINDTLVSTKTIKPTVYENAKHWPEMEFITIPFDTSFSIRMGLSYTIKFVTQNVGKSSMRIYSKPYFSNDFSLKTTCSNEAFSPSEKWPAKACIILADNSSTSVSDEAFKDYVYKDLEQNNNVISKYLNAAWVTNSTNFSDTDPLECLVLGGTHSNGIQADTKIKFHADSSFTGETLRLKYVSHLGTPYPLVIDVFINETKVTQFAPNWDDWNWQEIEITPFDFIAGQDYSIRFETKNANNSGFGLVRIYMDQPALPNLIWNNSEGIWTAPSASEFEHKALFEVLSIEGTDVYPDSINIDDSGYDWVYNQPYDGPGKAFIEILSCSSSISNVPSQICYPFSSYYSTTVSYIEDLRPVLKSAIEGLGMNSGFTVWDDALENYKNARQNYSKYLIPRYSIPGNARQKTILNNLKTIIKS